jgi:hypothetical protein
MKTHTVIAQTTKGHRIFLEGTAAVGWPMGATYSVTMGEDEIVLARTTEGKVRKVTSSKGGVIDLESKKVTAWAQGATQVRVSHTPEFILIERVQA